MKTKTLKFPIETCVRCKKPIADSYFAKKLGAEPKSSYCSYSDHCQECAFQTMTTATRKGLRFLPGAKVVKMEVDRFDLRSITVAKGTHKWVLKSDGGHALNVSEILKRKEKK
jgi:hypothetical protein